LPFTNLPFHISSVDLLEQVKPGWSSCDETEKCRRILTLPQRTVVEAVLQILRVHPEACILLCAPSNPATDTLVLRLRSVLNPQEMLRLNDQNRTFAEVPTKIMQYCCIY